MVWCVVILTAGPAWAQTDGLAMGSLRERSDGETYFGAPPQDSLSAGIWHVHDGVDLFVLEAGHGEPVLFLHGGPGVPPDELPAGLIELASSFHVICPHQRGCGRSTRPIQEFHGDSVTEQRNRLIDLLGIEQQIADIERIRRIVGTDRISIIGHSFGAYLATLYAAEFPDRVNKLVLVCPAEMLRMPHPAGGLFEVIRQHLPTDSIQNYVAFLGRYLNTFSSVTTRTEKDLARLNEEFGTWYLRALAAHHDSLPEAAAPKPELVGGFMPFAVFLSLGMQYDHRAALSEVKCPILLLHGEHDLATAEGRLDWEQTLVRARVEVLQEVGHFPFLERPTDFARIVSDFLMEN